MQTFLELLARNALGSAILALLVLAISVVVRRPALRNAMWLIVFARLLLPPLWSVPIVPAEATVVERSSAAPLAEPIARSEPVEDVAAITPEPVREVREPTEFVLPWIEAPTDPVDRPAVALPAAAQSASEGEGEVRAAVTGGVSLPDWWARALFAVWSSGCLFVVALAIVRVRRFERGLRDAALAPNDVQEQAEKLARRIGLKQCPAVWLTPGRVPPMLWMSGLFAKQARLILPLELFLRLDAEQRSALMAHELAHLRRGDPWVRWLELATVAVYWWFPLLRFFRRRLRESEEQCCDGWVVALLSQRKAYATALVETVEYLDRSDCPAAPALASGASPVHDLQRRLTMIMRGTVRGRLTKFGALTVLGVAVGALAFGPAFTQAQPDPSEKKDRPGRDGDRDFPPRGERGGDRDPGPKGELDRFPPKGERGGERDPGPKDRFPPKEGNEEFQKAMQELQRAREDAMRALQRVREMEERIMKLTGGGRGPGPMGGGPNPLGPGPMGGRTGPVGGGPGAGPNPKGGPDPMGGRPNPLAPDMRPFGGGPGPGPMGGGPGPFGPGPGPGGLGGGPGPMGGGPEQQLQKMQRQLEEMRMLIEELRREMNRGPGGRNPDGPRPKGQPDRKNFTPDNVPGGYPGAPGGRGGFGGAPGGFPGGPGGPGGGGRGGPEKLPSPPEKN